MKSSEYFDNYCVELAKALNTVDVMAVDQLYDSIVKNINYPIYVFGNGGSAAIADHFCADINKGVFVDTTLKIRAVSLVSNIPVLTAFANDFSYDDVFAEQIKMLKDFDGLALAVSSSGNSKNVVRGLQIAQKTGLRTAALVGFTGGAVVEHNLAETIVHVRSDNYGVVEDSHMIILHTLAQKLRLDYAVRPPKL